MERLDELEDDEMEAEGYIEGLQEETQAEVKALYELMAGETDRLSRIENLVHESQNQNYEFQEELDDEIFVLQSEADQRPNTLASVTPQKTEQTPIAVDEKLEDALNSEVHKEIFTILGVMAIAVAVGSTVGAICVFSCQKCCSYKRKSKLAKAQEAIGHFNLPGTEANCQTLDNDMNTQNSLDVSPPTPDKFAQDREA